MYHNDEGNCIVNKYNQLKNDLFIAKLSKIYAWFTGILLIILIGINCYNVIIEVSQTHIWFSVIACLSTAVAFYVFAKMYKDNNKYVDFLKDQIHDYEDIIANWRERKSREIEEERELNKERMLNMQSKLTEKQTETLNIYAEKAKHYFKWLLVTENGEVVACTMKPDYDEQLDVWFFNSEATTIQVGKNKKLAKLSKFTLTEIK